MRTPFTDGCAEANEKASPPGLIQSCTLRPTTFSSVQSLPGTGRWENICRPTFVQFSSVQLSSRCIAEEEFLESAVCTELKQQMHSRRGRDCCVLRARANRQFHSLGHVLCKTGWHAAIRPIPGPEQQRQQIRTNCSVSTTTRTEPIATTQQTFGATHHTERQPAHRHG